MEGLTSALSGSLEQGSLRRCGVRRGRYVPFRVLVVIVTVAGVLSGCDFKKEADAKFGDQHFKTVISLVELHKVRTGSYPAALTDLEFLGDWDSLAISAVEYKRLGDGYEINVVRGWVGQPDLEYPAEFWNGLGLRRSNLKPAP
jgi:hypothetical protein